MHRVEHWLDQGMGSCLLQVPQAAQQVADAASLNRRLVEEHGLHCPGLPEKKEVASPYRGE